MRIQDRRGEAVPEATVTVDEAELVDLLHGLADLIEGKKELFHLTESEIGGTHLVFKRGSGDEVEPLERQIDWWVGPLVLVGAIFMIIGAVTFVRWAINLVG